MYLWLLCARNLQSIYDEDALVVVAMVMKSDGIPLDLKTATNLHPFFNETFFFPSPRDFTN